jgi:tRNA (guanine37-N1)-methyltransferase
MDLRSVRSVVGPEVQPTGNDMRFDVLTLFPAILEGYLGQSLLKKAIDAGLVSVELHDIRRWSRDKHHKVDDRPFGGGPGMILQVEPVVESVEAVQAMTFETSAPQPGHLILLSPQGRRLDQQVVEELAGRERLVLLCGRYEGFDHRVIEILKPDEISIGDYVLNGGEVAAMAVIDAVIRLVPGVLGDDASSAGDSFSSGNRLLEFAQYTRPREYRGHEVPEVLLNGNHEEIARWRREQSYLNTRQRRADLLNQPTTDTTKNKD